MATTYLAPGVYVEEVPSAQQPIAGVGTNTVGFIGIVKKTIQYPVPNDDYDDYLAQALFRGNAKDATEDDKKAAAAAQAHLDQLTGGGDAGAQARRNADKALKDAQDELDKRKAEASAPVDPNAPTPGGRKPDLKPLEKKVADAAEALRKLSLTASNEDKFLKPYRLETFEIEPDVLDTKLCTNFTEYTDRFGPYPADSPEFDGHRALTHAVAGFFKNGGTRCFVARIEDDSQLDAVLKKFESIDEIALLAAPGIVGRANWGALVTHCTNMEDRFAILDCHERVSEDPQSDEFDVKLLNYSEKPSDFMPDRNKNAAFYFPYIEVVDPAKQLMDRDPKRDVWINNRGKLFVPPSGHVAGVYARVDEQRGVHKAPANESLMGATNVRYFVGKRHQELLNPQGVNCIRNINGAITVYGGRTVGGDRNTEWKYVNVRRVMLFLKESIDEGTQWVVFEPNDRALWAKIRLNVSAFLTRVWKSGALFGSTPQEAFYVKCDDETNPPEVRDVGQVIVEVGVAIVRPAEFVIFRVTQWAGPTKS